jgi:hypothetical protein
LKAKYVICPGFVRSSSDGQEHYVGPMELIRLYGVSYLECEIYEPAPWWPRSHFENAESRQQGLHRLGPRYDGNYDLKKVIAEIAE